LSEIRSALITGIGGSGGSYLAEYIAENHPQVALHGFARWHSTTAENLANLKGRVTVHEVDLNDFGSVLEAMQRVKPDAIFHLAAHANVRASFITPHAVLSNNILGTSNLFEAIRLSKLDPLIQLCSTSEVYGQVLPHEVPIHEDQPMRPSSPYAVSKVAQDLLGYTYFVAYKMRVIRTRMFAYLNPRPSTCSPPRSPARSRASRPACRPSWCTATSTRCAPSSMSAMPCVPTGRLCCTARRARSIISAVLRP
jgi:GDP-4-dehydro-6-deoxy-D-mannose reductase